ncbi:nuclear transport factor 2 family protein [Streptomyces sp. NPDC048479]|uniref:ester cyclase n=1 Tax=Streptomyces sp. NPDC048479 TaxID=3154725 RepID=UPI00341C40D4
MSVRRFLDEVVNGGDVALVDELWAQDMSWHGGSIGEYRGLEDWKASLASSGVGSFTGMHLDIKEVIANGDKVVWRTRAGSSPYAVPPSANCLTTIMGIQSQRPAVPRQGTGSTVRRDQTTGTGKVGYSTPDTCWTTRMTWQE